MKVKKILLLSMILIAFLSAGVFIEIENAEACKCVVCKRIDPTLCSPDCDAACGVGSSCSETGHACSTDGSVSNLSVCLIGGPNSRNCEDAFPGECVQSDSWRYCSEDRCRTVIGGMDIDDATVNGVACKVTTVGGNNCDGVGDYVMGVWDYEDEKCVQCNDANGVVETANCGDSGATHFNGSCNGIADNEFESACGADSACDEVSGEGSACTVGELCENGEGAVCVAGGTCDANGRCLEPPDCANTDRSAPNIIVPCKCGTTAFANPPNDFCCAADSDGAGSVYSGLGVCPVAVCTCAADIPACYDLTCVAAGGDSDCACAAQGGNICAAGETCSGASLDHNGAGVCCDVACTSEDEDEDEDEDTGGGTGHGNYTPFDKDIVLVFTEGAEFLLRIAGGIALFMLVFGGLYYTISGSNPSGQVVAKKTLVYAIIGLAIVLVSYIIIMTVESFTV